MVLYFPTLKQLDIFFWFFDMSLICWRFSNWQNSSYNFTLKLYLYLISSIVTFNIWSKLHVANLFLKNAFKKLLDFDSVNNLSIFAIYSKYFTNIWQMMQMSQTSDYICGIDYKQSLPSQTLPVRLNIPKYKHSQPVDIRWDL